MGRKSISHIRKPEILKHTYKVVEEEGFMGMTIGKVAARMGVNSGLLIHYFKSKEGLIMEMVDYLYAVSMTAYLKALEKFVTPEERLEALLDMVFDTRGNGPQRDAVFWSCYAMGFRDDRIRKKMKGMMEKFIAFSMAEIHAWERTGLTAGVADTQAAAAAIMALSEGFGILRNSIDDRKILEKVAQLMKKTAWEALSSDQEQDR